MTHLPAKAATVEQLRAGRVPVPQPLRVVRPAAGRQPELRHVLPGHAGVPGPAAAVRVRPALRAGRGAGLRRRAALGARGRGDARPRRRWRRSRSSCRACSCPPGGSSTAAWRWPWRRGCWRRRARLASRARGSRRRRRRRAVAELAPRLRPRDPGRRAGDRAPERSGSPACASCVGRRRRRAARRRACPASRSAARSAAPQIASTAQVYATSTRSLAPFPYLLASSTSLTSARLLEQVVPFPFGRPDLTGDGRLHRPRFLRQPRAVPLDAARGLGRARRLLGGTAARPRANAGCGPCSRWRWSCRSAGSCRARRGSTRSCRSTAACASR